MIASQLLLSMGKRRWRGLREAKEEIALVLDGRLIVRLFPMFLVLQRTVFFFVYSAREKKSSGDATMNDVSQKSILIVYNYAVHTYNASFSSDRSA